MRIILFLLLFLCSLVASATDYYISSAGNDSANGLSASSPWKTIGKVNSVFSQLNPGDRILFERGGIFKGTLIISRSGIKGNPITIGAYGNGEKPVVTGFTDVTGWTNEGGGIYSKTISTESTIRMVSLDGVNTPMGRWPNTEWTIFDAFSGSTQLSDATLNSAVTNWTGADIVIRNNYFIISCLKISSHSGSTLTFPKLTYPLTAGYGFFIQNDLRTLDTYGEWFYNSGASKFYMFFGSGNPDSHKVQVASTIDAIRINSYSNVNVENIKITGYNEHGVELSLCPNVTIKDCDISFCGGSGISGNGNSSAGTSENLIVTRNTINEIENCGIRLYGGISSQFIDATISNNTITNVGINPGGGESYNIYTRYGILLIGSSAANTKTIIEYNRLNNIGYSGIEFGNTHCTVRYNVVDGWCMTLADGGGIYTYNNNVGYVHNNIILNGYGNMEGTSTTYTSINGLYCDGISNNVRWENNTVAGSINSGSFGYGANGNDNGTIKGNTFYNNWNQIYLSGASKHENTDITDNIFFSRGKQLCLLFYDATSELVTSTKTDYNYYCRPIDGDADGIIVYWINSPYQFNNFTLSEFKTRRGQDANSHGSPIRIDNENKIRFEYNATSNNKELALNGSYIDVKGTKYFGTITLLPYTSLVLMVDPNPSVPPAAPVYIRSSIENAAPSRLEMTYSLSLANIVPAASSFTVLVNSTVRTVSSVAISGTKVLLTLTSPVATGNVVTVAYTKPSANPLQTSGGGQAASISAQTVANKVAEAPIPVYVSSSIENTTPSRLEMTYSLSLANIVPAISAFEVKVNSTARNVTSVAISGTKVLLTLTSPVAAGNVVTVAYTKPSANPLQTSTGGQAASIGAQTVVNKVNVINIPPVIVVISPKNSYSGFVNEISAGGSYDANKDNLSFTWSAPANIPISSPSGAIIKFLGPIVNKPTTVEFTVRVSDGKTILTEVVPVMIIPYKPELETAEVISIEANSFQPPNYPNNIMDGNIGTMWSSVGDNQWLIIELKQLFSIQHVKLAFQPGQKRESYFDIFGSQDKETWEPILTKSASCNFTGDLQVFEFPQSKAEKEFRYVKLVGLGNSTDKSNYISELKIFGNRFRNPESYENLAVKLYPNPAHGYVNVRIDDPSLSFDFIRILNHAGTVLINDEMIPGVMDYQIELNLSNGIYLVQMGTGNLTTYVQKLIVNN